MSLTTSVRFGISLSLRGTELSAVAAPTPNSVAPRAATAAVRARDRRVRRARAMAVLLQLWLVRRNLDPAIRAGQGMSTRVGRTNGDTAVSQPLTPSSKARDRAVHQPAAVRIRPAA